MTIAIVQTQNGDSRDEAQRIYRGFQQVAEGQEISEIMEALINMVGGLIIVSTMANGEDDPDGTFRAVVADLANVVRVNWPGNSAPASETRQ